MGDEQKLSLTGTKPNSIRPKYPNACQVTKACDRSTNRQAYNLGMNLLDKLVLALRSAVNDVVSEDVVPVTKEEQVHHAIDKAQARLDTLRDDLARAEKRGQDELAARLKQEIADLQKTLDKTRKRLNKIKGREVAASAIEQTHETKKAQRKDDAETKQVLDAREEVVAKREDVNATRDELDNTRIADVLKKKE